MKFRVGLALAFSIFALKAHAEKMILVKKLNIASAFVGETLVDPATSKILKNAVIVIAGGRIENVGSAGERKIPDGAKIVDCKGKFILPGYIDTHVHFFQSGDLFTRPDVVDLTKVRPYAEEIAWVKSHLNDTFARYLRSGITSVVDVGGPFWNLRSGKLLTQPQKRRALLWRGH